MDSQLQRAARLYLLNSSDENAHRLARAHLRSNFVEIKDSATPQMILILDWMREHLIDSLDDEELTDIDENLDSFQTLDDLFERMRELRDEYVVALKSRSDS